MAEVELERDGGVAVVTLNAPQRRNALTSVMARELIAAMEEVDADASIGATVVRGAGRQFCAGGDRETLARFGRDPAAPDNYEDNGIVYESFHRVGRSAVPTVAAVRGAAVGAGVNLLMATDLRIVANDARILAGFLRIGIHPGGGHFVLASRLMGREATAATALFSEELDGERCRELGLAWESLPEDEVENRAIELASRVARDPELSRTAVRSFRRELGPPGIPWDVALEVERAPQMWSLRRRDLHDDQE